MENPTEHATTAVRSGPSEAEIIGCKGVRLLFLIAAQSSLSPHEFWKALARLANNKALMLTALNNGTWEHGKPNPKEAQKPIEIPE